jgi:hypothetical protein
MEPRRTTGSATAQSPATDEALSADRVMGRFSFLGEHPYARDSPQR